MPLSLNFPTAESMGMLWSRDLGTAGHSGWKQVGEARGTVTLPPNKEAMLQIKPETQPNLTPLAAFASDALHTLDLWDTKVSDADLKHLSGLTGLRGLNLSRTKITDAGLDSLSGLSHLQVLNLYGTQISDAGLPKIAPLKSLQTLWINKTAVTDAGLAHLKSLTALKELYVADTSVTDSGKNALKSAIPGCQIRAGKGSLWSY